MEERVRKRARVESRAVFNVMNVPQCGCWHMNSGPHGFRRRRCSVFGCFRRSRLRNVCPYGVQHSFGIVVQIRTDDECARLHAELLAFFGSGNVGLVSLMVDYDHGGSSAARGRISQRVIEKMREGNGGAVRPYLEAALY